MTIGLTIIVELIFVSFLIILFYQLKPRFGLTPLYILIGANQYFQTVLASSFSINIFGSYYISPGSVILFSSGLFAILFIYIKEGVRSTQSLILGVILTNLSITLLALITQMQLSAMQGIIISSGSPLDFFTVNFRIFLVGTIILVLDTLIIVILYEFLYTKVKRFNIFFRLLFTMLIVLNFDAIFFIMGSFWNSPDLGNRIVSQVIGKSAAAVFFATVLYLYLYYFDNKKIEDDVIKMKGNEDIFSILTYRGRYEKLMTEKAISDEKLYETISSKTMELEKSVKRFTILSSIKEMRLDRFSSKEQADEFLQKVKEAFEVDACTIHLLEKNELVLLSSLGIRDDELENKLDAGIPYFIEIIQNKKCLAIEDTSLDKLKIEKRENGACVFNYISCLGAPLLSGNAVIGVIKIYSRTVKRIFSKIEKEHFQMVASQVLYTLENAQLYLQNEKQKEILVKQIIARKKVEELIKANNTQLRQLTIHLQNIREEERRRIGREIHDDLGQQLTAIKMDAAWIDKKTPEEAILIKEKLKNIISLLDGSNKAVRRILNELKPSILDEYGLQDAIEWHAKQFSDNTGIPVTFEGSLHELKVSENIATCIFRVFQESLTNITRYAQAKNIITSLNIDGETIAITIQDDGVGFIISNNSEKITFGILGMQERVNALGGNFKINSEPGKGTLISVEIPFKKK
jgi:signal transduction histidine kinase